MKFNNIKTERVNLGEIERFDAIVVDEEVHIIVDHPKTAHDDGYMNTQRMGDWKSKSMDVNADTTFDKVTEATMTQDI